MDSHFRLRISAKLHYNFVQRYSMFAHRIILIPQTVSLLWAAAAAV
jgi:hypothetical protein